MPQTTGRPTSFEDLDEYQRSGQRLAMFSVCEFQDDPELLRAYADFIHAAMNAGHTVEGGTIDRFVTEEDREAKLALAQRQWDSMKRQYDEWVNGSEPTYKSTIESWAKSQGLPHPEQVSA